MPDGSGIDSEASFESFLGIVSSISPILSVLNNKRYRE